MNLLLDLLFPKRCAGCKRVGSYICASCRKTMRPIGADETICPVCEKPALAGLTHPKCRGRYAPDGLTSFFHYDAVVKSTVKAIKYRLVSDMAREVVECIPPTSYNMILTDGNRNFDVLIPIPLHAKRFRARGFNQAEILGIRVAGHFGVPTEAGALIRVKETVPQVQMMSRTKRLSNMRGVFAVSDSLRNFPWSRVVLFDDVFTTGATMREAANVLKRHGVLWVWVVTLAR